MSGAAAREAGAGRVVESRLRVRYSETDQMGIVYHAHYLVWFEIGRTEWCRAAGIPYAEMERAGLFIPVTRVEATFRRRSSYDDAIRIEAAHGGALGPGLRVRLRGARRGERASGGRVHSPHLHGPVGPAPQGSSGDSRAARNASGPVAA